MSNSNDTSSPLLSDAEPDEIITRNALLEDLSEWLQYAAKDIKFFTECGDHPGDNSMALTLLDGRHACRMVVQRLAVLDRLDPPGWSTPRYPLVKDDA